LVLGPRVQGDIWFWETPGSSHTGKVEHGSYLALWGRIRFGVLVKFHICMI